MQYVNGETMNKSWQELVRQSYYDPFRPPYLSAGKEEVKMKYCEYYNSANKEERENCHSCSAPFTKTIEKRIFNTVAEAHDVASYFMKLRPPTRV